MNLVVLTSRRRGTAAHHLPLLQRSDCCTVSAVIYNRGEAKSRAGHWKRKLRKTLKIGPLGALNGIRMRSWYREGVREYLQIGELHEVCRRYNMPYFETSAIDSDETRHLFEQADADLGLSLGNPYIPESVFGIPRHGMLNIHHELLPEYQGAQSVIWQLYNGSTQTGYTIHRISPKIDGGDILHREERPILFEDTLGATVSRTSASLLEHSGRGLLHVLENYEELSRRARPQGEGEGRTYTTPTIWQFLRILRNYRRLREV